MTTAAVIELLCERFPRCFAWDEAQRRPLKIGIFKELRAALKGVISSHALSRALEVYVTTYRPGLEVGAARIGLDGEPAGFVEAGHIAKLQPKARSRSSAVSSPPAAAPSSPPQPILAPASKPGPQRSSLADLRAAAVARKNAPK